MTAERLRVIKGHRRVVVKLGSMVLADPAGGVDQDLINGLAAQAVDLIDRGYTLTLVSSGAILMGLRELGRQSTPQSVKVKQALAAVGQGKLMHAYGDAFARHGIRVGQVLLTSEGLEQRERFIHSRNTIRALHRLGVLPIINENDTVAVDEIRYGDNDFLASMVVNLVEADLFIILTTTSGLYDRDPRLGEGKLVHVVDQVDREIVSMAGGPGEAGSGGMSSKVQAAGRTARMGVPTVIADGRAPGVLTDVAAGNDVGTLFLPSSEKLASRKHWIAYSGRATGKVVIDEGAVKAVTSGKKSLLPAGVLAVEGDFRAGGTIVCVDEKGREVARGVTCFSSDQVREIMGRQSTEIESVLGSCPGEEVIHRDDLVVTGEEG